MGEMVERVARALDAVQMFSRINDWASDRVPNFPVEICRYGLDGEDEIVVVKRFGGDVDEGDALRSVIREQRARAAIAAMREPTIKMVGAADHRQEQTRDPLCYSDVYLAMIDAALSD